jgi:hypothetical protein
MKARTNYEQPTFDTNWILTPKILFPNMEMLWYSKIAELKYGEKKAQPPTNAIRNAGFSAKLKVEEN